MSQLSKPTITPQGVNSTTWTPPPFDTEFTVPGLYAFHAEKSPNHPVFVYDDEDGEVKTLYHKDVYSAICKVAHYVTGLIGQPSEQDFDAKSAPIGILAVADSISYATLTVGVMRAGHVPFPHSARNSAAAVTHLIRSTGIHSLFVSADGAMQRIAGETRDTLIKEGHDLQLLPFPTFSKTYEDASERPKGGLPKLDNVDVNGAALILHSSGSTSFPKPIKITHRQLQLWTQIQCYNDFDVCGLRVAIHGLPMFHVMGLLGLSMMLGCGATLCVFRPVSPPIVPTPEIHMDAILATKADSVFCVPSFIEAWARDTSDVLTLKGLKFVVYAGAPLNKEIGNTLAQHGVNIQTAFGMTEIGAIGWGRLLLTSAADAGWEWITIPDIVDIARVYVDDAPGIFELVVYDSPTWHPSVFNTELNGRKAYASNDLFMEHPRDPRLVRVYGRADDQIVLSTGEKTNPIPMEAILIHDPAIHAALMFGRGRFQNGVIIQPREPFDPADEAKLVAFRDLIWPTVERANKHAPAHSRIFKEMITVTHPSKPFQLTAKGTPRRHISLKEYDADIESLYQKVEESTQVDVAVPADWNEDTTRVYIRGVITSVMRAPTLADDDDLFQQGCDSLQATYIRNALMHALRSTTKVSVHAIPTNVVYNHPSINAMTEFFLRLLAGDTLDADTEHKKRLERMQKMLEKYSIDFAEPQWASENVNQGETVLITGSTGRLGSHLLSQMLQQPDVRRIYALNRGTSGHDRQLQAFVTWGLDPALLEGGDKVVFCAADLVEKDLGLGNSLYEELRSSVTMIIHNAWRVDFNVSLPSFEPLIAGARNLVDFSLASDVFQGPKVVFVSSIDALSNYSSSIPAEETLAHGPEVAVGRGYGESKWVTERVLGRATSATGLRTTVVRVGQLSGDTHLGGWGTKEWVPAIARASQKVGCAPAKDDTVAWVPIDIAAATLLDILRAPVMGVAHLTAPHPVSWSAVFEPMATRLRVPLVPAAEWLAQVRTAGDRANAAGEHESAFQLMNFFDGVMGAKEVLFATDRSVAMSKTLAGMKQLGEDDVEKWLAYWSGFGFLEV